MAHDITWVKKGVIVCLYGKIDIQEIFAANGKLHGDSRFDNHKFQIWNLLEADLSPAKENQAAYPAATDAVASSYAKDVKVSFISSNEHSIKFVKKYIEHSKERSIPWLFNLFESMDEAIEWVTHSKLSSRTGNNSAQN